MKFGNYILWLQTTGHWINSLIYFYKLKVNDFYFHLDISLSSPAIMPICSYQILIELFVSEGKFYVRFFDSYFSTYLFR